MVFVVFTVKCEWKSIPVFNRGRFKQEKLKSGTELCDIIFGISKSMNLNEGRCLCL